jgi:hypothetical protein
MKKVSELYGRHPGADIYVVGTGTSFRVFPKGFFDGKITIGLNMAWKNLPVTYGITIHPDLNIPEFMPGENPRPEITWVTGHHKARTTLTPEQLRQAEERCYFFEYHGQPNTQPADQPSDAGKILDWVRKPTGDFLYVWSSISQAGANLAANLGARNVIVVGCDNAPLGENHHAHAQHTRWKGVDPNLRYRQYYEGLADVRSALRERGVNLVSLGPFLKLDDPELDFARLCGELGVVHQLKSQDISPPQPPLWRRLRKQLRQALRS